MPDIVVPAAATRTAGAPMKDLAAAAGNRDASPGAATLPVVGGNR